MVGQLYLFMSRCLLAIGRLDRIGQPLTMPQRRAMASPPGRPLAERIAECGTTPRWLVTPCVVQACDAFESRRTALNGVAAADAIERRPLPGRLHADRASGRDRDHRGLDRALVAGRAGGARGRAADSMRQQSQAARPGDAQLRKFERRPAAPDGPDVQQRGCGGLEVEWGASSRITPYLELGSLYNAINYTNKTSDPSNATAVSTQLKVFICPSEVNQQAFTSTNTAGVTTTYGVSNYGWCEGTWYTFGGFGSWRAEPQCDSAPTSAARFASFTDGLSNTLLAREVKTYMPSYHDCGAVPPPGPTGPSAYPDIATVLASIAAAPTSGCKLATAPSGMLGRRPHPLVQRQLVLRRFHHGLAPQHHVAGRVAGPRQRHELRRRGRRRPDLRRRHLAQLPSRQRQRPLRRRQRALVKNSINFQTWRASGRSAAARSSRPTPTDASAR